ncbi:isochorismatase family protein, partial [Actinomadura sp. 7K507]|uniref:cysteine hydrolase family protein n=1 Tax=Actinomadura sp. 7K507 TaxID=2530365 RepID=UPI00104E32BD
MNRALLVIDVQESFRRRPNWPAVSAPDIGARAARLTAAARAAGDLVVWILHAEPGSGGVFDPALGDVRLMDGLEPAGGEPVLTKTSRNAFTTTALQRLLTERGIGELVVCGIQTEQCCETTARLAADLGYRVTFVTDATATFPI